MAGLRPAAHLTNLHNESQTMTRYIGTKIINAKPMNRLAYNQFRGWELPADEDGSDDGYLVEYTDGGKANVAGYTGYVSWSPKDVFERAYRPLLGIPLGLALEALQLGHRVARLGWPSTTWLVYMKPVSPTPEMQIRSGLYVTDGITFSAWAPSHADLLADDYVVLD